MRKRKGNILFTIMVLIALVSVAGVFVNMVFTSSTVVTAQVDRLNALYLAEAGFHKAVWYLQNTAPDASSGGTWRTGAYPDREGFDEDDDFNNGQYTLWVEDSGSNIKITSKGTLYGVTRTVQGEIVLGTPALIIPGSWTEK